MNEAQVSIKVRQRLGLPASERPRILTLIAPALTRLARQTALDPERRHLVETDRSSVTSTITNTNQDYYSDLGTVISTNGVMLDYLPLGTVWHTYTAKTFTDNDVDDGLEFVTISNHGFPTGAKVRLTTSGSLPSGLSLNTTYYAIAVSSDRIAFATSYANAILDTNTRVSMVADGTGTHTITNWESSKVQWTSREVHELTTGLPLTYVYGRMVDDRLYTNVSSGTFSFTVPAVPTISTLHAKLDEDLIDVICELYQGAGIEGMGNAEK